MRQIIKKEISAVRILLVFFIGLIASFPAFAQQKDTITTVPDSLQSMGVNTIPSTLSADSLGIQLSDTLKTLATDTLERRPDTLEIMRITPLSIPLKTIRLSRTQARDTVPTFKREDTTYEKEENLLPLHVEEEAELVYEDKWPVTPPKVTLETREPTWMYPEYKWRFGAVSGINFSQAAFSNWNAGGESNLNLMAYANLYLNRVTRKYEWNNTLSAAYGIQSFTRLEEVRKSEDKFEFNSKIGHKTGKKLFTTFQLNFASQFDVGYNYNKNPIEKISNFLAPGRLTASLGMEYKHSKAFSALFAPLTGRITLVMDQELADKGLFGVQGAQTDENGFPILGTGKNTRSELGMELTLLLNTPLGKNITLNSRSRFFDGYEKITSVVVNLQNTINFKVNNTVSANLNMEMIYDEDVEIVREGETEGKPRVQFKEIFSLGIRFDI